MTGKKTILSVGESFYSVIAKNLQAYYESMFGMDDMYILLGDPAFKFPYLVRENWQEDNLSNAVLQYNQSLKAYEYSVTLPVFVSSETSAGNYRYYTSPLNSANSAQFLFEVGPIPEDFEINRAELLNSDFCTHTPSLQITCTRSEVLNDRYYKYYYLYLNCSGTGDSIATPSYDEYNPHTLTIRLSQ